MRRLEALRRAGIVER
ncbi:hypothetical protein, partial [Klebsiella pneumoniae]